MHGNCKTEGTAFLPAGRLLACIRMCHVKNHWAGGLQAEKEADVIIWDGGNNDTPFFKPGAESPSAHGLQAPCCAKTAEASQYGGKQQQSLCCPCYVLPLLRQKPGPVTALTENLWPAACRVDKSRMSA